MKASVRTVFFLNHRGSPIIMSARRRSRRAHHAASHQRSWLTGRHVVCETLEAGIWPVRRLCVTAQAAAELSAAFPDGLPERIVPEQVSSERLTALCGSRHHQGMALLMGEFPCGSIADLPGLFQQARKHLLPPLFLMCDRIQDAHNLGAILRNCDAAAVTAVIIGMRQQVGITPHVARASAGAVNHVPLVRCPDLCEAADCLAGQGCVFVAADEKGSDDVRVLSGSGPAVLIIGSEAQGIAPDLLKRCSRRVAVPMRGHVSSLNAAVAAGILLHELRRDV